LDVTLLEIAKAETFDGDDVGGCGFGPVRIRGLVNLRKRKRRSEAPVGATHPARPGIEAEAERAAAIDEGIDKNVAMIQLERDRGRHF